MANVYFVLALKEKNKKWRWFGIIGSLYLAQICKSRLALVSLILTPILTFGLARLSRPFTLFLLGIASTITGILAPWLLNLMDTLMRKFTEARPNLVGFAVPSNILRVIVGKQKPLYGATALWNGAPI